jgi:hypothetical protein
LADLDTAQDVFIRLFTMARSHFDVPGQGISLAGLAALAAVRGNHTVAAQVLGAARAIPAAPGIRPSARHGYELADRLASAALGDDFDALRAHGTTLTPDQAATLAAVLTQ